MSRYGVRVATRTRRSPTDARHAILNAAAELLAEQGVSAVSVREVAKRVGMTDAGVTHHFGNRDTLLTELLRHGGRHLRARLHEVLATWLNNNGVDLHELIKSLELFYRNGFGELAAALHAAGWRDRGSGMLDPVVEALHQLRPRGSSLDDTRRAVAAVHQAMATEHLYGSAFRRSAGLTGRTGSDPSHQVRWWARQLELALDIDNTPPSS